MLRAVQADFRELPAHPATTNEFKQIEFFDLTPFEHSAIISRVFSEIEFLDHTGALLQRDAAQADDEVRQGPVPCRHDPAKRHGPYFEWTYKAKGKTVNVKLTRDVMPLFRAASHQDRKLRSLLNRLETLSQTVLRRQAKLAQSDRE